MRYLFVSNRVAIRAMHFEERGSGYLEMGRASPARSTVRATTSRWTGGSVGTSGGAEGQDPACWCGEESGIDSRPFVGSGGALR